MSDDDWCERGQTEKAWCDHCQYEWEKQMVADRAELAAIVVGLAGKRPDEYYEWIEQVKGSGLVCHLCGAIVQDGTKGISVYEPMPINWHAESCPWRRAREWRDKR